MNTDSTWNLVQKHRNCSIQYSYNVGRGRYNVKTDWKTLVLRTTKYGCANINRQSIKNRLQYICYNFVNMYVIVFFCCTLHTTKYRINRQHAPKFPLQ